MKTAFDTTVFARPEDMQIPVHEDYSAAYKMEYSYDSQREDDTAARFAESMRTANTDVITALYTLFGQTLEAINSLADRPIELDGKAIMKSTEKYQRQRGANILAGGVS